MQDSNIRVGAVPQVAAGRLSGGESPFSLLTRDDSLMSTNLGGKWALPSEFDATTFVGGFYAEGQEARAMEAPQPLVGTPYKAPGWSVWKYPDTQPTGKTEEKSGKPILEKHPLAGQPHKVAGVKAGENYVLMFRPLAVQHQVNRAYGNLSTELMVQEVRGESNVAQQGDASILTNARLSAEIGVDRAVEEELSQGRVTTSANLGPVERPTHRVGR